MVTRHHDYNIGHAGTRTYLRRMLITTSDRDKHESTIHSYKTLRGRNPSIDSFQFILRVDTYIVNYFGMLNLVCEMKLAIELQPWPAWCPACRQVESP